MRSVLVVVAATLAIPAMAARWLFTQSSAARPALDFAEQTVGVGKGPGFIAIADLNHDGNPDIVVANTEDATVSVLLGDSEGNFAAAPASPFPCNPNPNDIAVADMNGDGNPDLVIANHQTPYITLLLGDGKGSFVPAPRSPFATQSHPHPHGVAVGDFMGNGKPAVVTDSWGSGEILLLSGDGKGGLILPGKLFPAGGRFYDSGVRAAAFTKDGHLDIVTVGHHGNGVGLLLGDGKGGFRPAAGSPFPAGANAWTFTVEDVNGDGNPDVVTIPYQPDLGDPHKLEVTVLLGNGKGGLNAMPGPPLLLSGCNGPDRVAAGDIAGNGLRDIVVSCAENNKIFFFLQQTDRSFRSFSRNVLTGWGGLAVGKLGRGKRDSVLVSNRSSATITILRPQ